ncbi:hypothetical protein ACFPRL_18220 [Pseudoclavibacter helvolus]
MTATLSPVTRILAGPESGRASCSVVVDLSCSSATAGSDETSTSARAASLPESFSLSSGAGAAEAAPTPKLPATRQAASATTVARKRVRKGFTRTPRG